MKLECFCLIAAFYLEKKSPQKPQQRIPKKYFSIHEKNVLIEATKALKANHQTDADVIYDFVAKNEKCQEAKITEKFTKEQLANKVKKLFKEHYTRNK